MKKAIRYFLEKEIFRFLLIGGINTILGGVILPFLFKTFFGTIHFTLIIPFDLSLTFGYLIWFPFAYKLQVSYVFKTKFSWNRFFVYPFTQIPNYLVNSMFLFVFESIFSFPSLLSFFLSAFLAVPVMFVLVKFVVKVQK